jgi:hypothetical protein
MGKYIPETIILYLEVSDGEIKVSITLILIECVWFDPDLYGVK